MQIRMLAEGPVSVAVGSGFTLMVAEDETGSKEQVVVPMVYDTFLSVYAKVPTVEVCRVSVFVLLPVADVIGVLFTPLISYSNEYAGEYDEEPMDPVNITDGATGSFWHTAEVLAEMVALGVGRISTVTTPERLRTQPFASLILMGVYLVIPGVDVGMLIVGVANGSAVEVTGAPLPVCVVYVKVKGALPVGVVNRRVGAADDWQYRGLGSIVPSMAALMLGFG